MDVKVLLAANSGFNTWKAELEAKIKSRQSELVEANKVLTVDAFMQLDYAEAKELYEAMKYNLEFKTQRKEIEEALEKVKAIKYPLMGKAHLYPILNEMDFLTDEQKHNLDAVVLKFRRGYLMLGSSVWYSMKLSSELVDKVLEFLHTNGVTEKVHRIFCPCRDASVFMTETIYKEHQQYFEWLRDFSALTDEQKAWIETFSDNGRVWEVGCECEGVQIESMLDIDNNCEVIYKVVKEPDFTHSNL